MTNAEKTKCHAIIHSFAVAGGAGNAVPLLKFCAAVDTVTITLMCMSLARVFGFDLDQAIARAKAATAVKVGVLAKPSQVIANKLSDCQKWLGPVAASAISITYIEIVGWDIACRMERQAHSANSDCCIGKALRHGPGAGYGIAPASCATDGSALALLPPITA